jgi:hypothetical protein
VGAGILAQLALVVPGAGDLALVHDDRADGHVIMFQGTLCFSQGEPHEVFVAWEESIGHFVSPGTPAGLW